MNNFPRKKEERLLELLGQELELFGRIREQTAAQAELLKADDSEGFGRSLDERQGIIEKIDGLHQECDALMQSYISFSDPQGDRPATASGGAGPSGAAPSGGGKIEKIERAALRLREAIAECVELNDKNAALAQDMAEEYIKQIGNLSLKRKSLGKYALGVPNNPEHFDKMT